MSKDKEKKDRQDDFMPSPDSAQDGDFFDRNIVQPPFRPGFYQYLKIIVIALALVGMYCLIKRDYVIMGVRSLNYYLINSMFAVGILYIGIGAFSMANQDGFFDIAGYGFSRAGGFIKSVFSPKSSHKKPDKNLYEYKKRKSVKRLGWKYHFVIVGFAMFFVSLLLVYFEYPEMFK